MSLSMHVEGLIGVPKALPQPTKMKDISFIRLIQIFFYMIGKILTWIGIRTSKYYIININLNNETVEIKLLSKKLYIFCLIKNYY